MRVNASATLRNRVLGVSAVFLLFVIAGCAAVFASIHVGVNDAARSAMTKYPGDRVQALGAVVDCPNCSREERNRAVWALGQIRDARALPILMKYYNQPGQTCRQVCQHELQKAVEAIQRKHPVWLGDPGGTRR